MAESDKTTHISESKMERFSVRNLSEDELPKVARHLTGCPDCQAEFVSTLRRQRGVADLSFTLAPEFWLRHEHLDYEQLVEFAEGKLDVTDRELIDLHLKVCPACSEDVKSLLAFREQITPEMRVSYAPLENESVKERLPWVSWWRGRTWQPVYSAALVAIGMALVIAAALLLNRRPESQQAQQSPTPQVSPGLTPYNRADDVPSPPPNELAIEKPTSAEPVVVLNDLGRTITVDRSGKVIGLDGVPGSTRDDIAKVLLSERLEQPAILKELEGQDAALRGSNNAQPFKLTYPSRTVIVSDRPTLRWEPASGASSYRVYVNDLAGQEVAWSDELPPEHTEWTAPKPLMRGRIYTWTVIAVVAGREIVSPEASSPEMKFQVLSTSSVAQLNKLKKARSHLALGIFYAREGMISEAEGEFRTLVRENPKSEHANKLLREVQSWRSR